MSKKNFDISRRKLIAGLGTAGVAAAGAGLGTTAYLSDTESFTGNSITAGTLDMTVTADVVAADDYWSERVDLEELRATADGEAVAGINVSDVKPGDWGIICFDIDIAENPGYVRVSTANLTTSEGTDTEPETDTLTENGGELEEAILATVWSEYGGGDRASLTGLDDTTNVAGGGMPSHSWDSARAEGGEVSETIEYATLREAFGEYSTGVTISDADGNAIPVSSEDGFVGQFCLLLEIPTEVGNEIQGDTLSFDLVFDAVQARHNAAGDPTFNATAE